MRYGAALGVILIFSGCNRSSPPAAPLPQQQQQQVQAQPSAAVEAPLGAAAATPAPPVAPPKPQTFTAPAGRRLRIRTATAISTKTAKNGDRFQGVLTEAITTAGGTVIAPQGATVWGVVATSDPGGRVKGVAGLAVRLTRLELADGRPVDIVTSVVARQAPATKKKDALKIGIGSGVGAAIGALAGGGKGAAIGAGSGAGAGTGVVLATRGDAAVIPSESVLTFQLRKPVSYTR